jgi:hypothetical protein
MVRIIIKVMIAIEIKEACMSNTSRNVLRMIIISMFNIGYSKVQVQKYTKLIDGSQIYLNFLWASLIANKRKGEL